MNSSDDQHIGVFEKQIGLVQPLWPIDGTLTIISLVGFALNVVLLAVVCRRKKAWAVDTMLISIVAFLDIVLCCTIQIGLLWRWIVGDSVLVGDSKWCQFSAILFNGSSISGIVCTAILASVRYLAISHKLHLSNFKWMIVSCFLVITIWSFYIFKEISVKLIVMPAGFYCIPEATGLNWFGTIFEWYMNLVICVSILLTPAAYILITAYYRKLSTNLNDVQYITSKINHSMLQLTAILIAYLIATLPDAIYLILCVSHEYKRAPLYDGLLVTLTYCLTIINAIFALLLHDEIHLEFRSFIGFPVHDPNFFYMT